jgi:hypothetical protein
MTTSTKEYRANIEYSSRPSISYTQQFRRDKVDTELPTISETSKQNLSDRTWTGLYENERTQKLQHYLESLVQTKEVARTTASITSRIWIKLLGALSNNLSVPDAGAGPDGEILFTWNKDDHHFELEIFPDNHGEFFYLNYRTDEMWEHEYKIEDSVPDEVKTTLKLFSLYD